MPAQRQPWERPGWFERALAWINATISDQGWVRGGEPVQVRHTAVSAVLRVPTSAGDLYFKANNQFSAHEGRLTEMLWRLAPDRVPEIGIIKEVLGFRQFSLRGELAAAGEWCLVCLAFNLKRFHTLSGV